MDIEHLKTRSERSSFKKKSTTFKEKSTTFKEKFTSFKEKTTSFKEKASSATIQFQIIGNDLKLGNINTSKAVLANNKHENIKSLTF